MTPVQHSLSMKSGSTPMKVIHISAIFAQARVYSRSLKAQHDMYFEHSFSKYPAKCIGHSVNRYACIGGRVSN